MDMHILRSVLTDAPLSPRGRSIGEILVDAGRLDADAANRIVALQQQEKLRFGEAGVRLRLLQPADVEFALSQQFAYPYQKAGPSNLSRTLVCALEPFGSAAEQVRSLRTRIATLRSSTGLQLRTLAIVSPGRGEGRSFMAANLAITFAQAGERVLLIDADLRMQAQHRLFGLGNRQGLSNLLLGRSDLDCIVPVAGFEHLSVLPAGSRAPNPQELLGWPRFASLLHEAAANFDRVVIDTPATSVAADAHLVALRSQGTLLLARANATNANALLRLRSSLRESGATVVGTVLNGG